MIVYLLEVEHVQYFRDYSIALFKGAFTVNRKIIFRLAGTGLFIWSILLMNFNKISDSGNSIAFIIVFFAILLWFIPGFLKPVKSLQKSIIYLNVLIVFLILIVLYQLIRIIEDPGNLNAYGWSAVGICFIIAYLLIRKENMKKLKEQ